METGSLVILLKLILSHTISDFALQSKKMVDRKSKRDILSHVLHASIHAAFAYIILCEWRLWYLPVTILITHFVIDYLKTYCKRDLSAMTLLVADQV